MTRTGLSAAALVTGAGVLALVAGGLAVVDLDDRPDALDVAPPAVTLGASPPQPADGRPMCEVSPILVPACGRWWGVAPAALTGAPRTGALEDFESSIGRRVDIYHAYHRDDELFPTAEERLLARDPGGRRLLLLNWKPSTSSTWREVADGAADDRIDALAAHVRRTFPERFFLTVWHEPENDVVSTPGSGMTAQDYAAMYRHVVARLRERGVSNAVTVMTYMGSPEWGIRPWFGELYPGDDVVDWIGVDPYIHAVPRRDVRGSFTDLVNKTGPGWPGFYAWTRATHPDKPVMVSEWGVFEDVERPARKPWVFRTAGKEIDDFPAIKALVYFDSPRAPKGDTRVDSSQEALEAFRRLGTLPAFVGPAVPSS